MGSRLNVIFCIVTALLFVFSITVNANSSGNSNDIDDIEPIVSIIQDDGVEFTQTINFSGTSNVPLANLYWKIHEINSGDLLSDLGDTLNSSNIFSDVEIINDQWHWELSIPSLNLDCVCKLSVYYNGTDNLSNLPLDSIIFYYGTSNHFPIIEFIPSYQAQTSIGYTNLTYQIISPSYMSNHPITLANSTSFKAKICSYTGSTCESEPFIIDLAHSNLDQNIYQLTINHSNLGLDDGNWLFEIGYRDSALRYSNIDVKVITFDSSPPIVQIFGKAMVSDMDIELYSVEYNDGYVNSKVGITWTIFEPNGEIRAASPMEKIDENSIELQFTKSGVWKISVLVIDSVGLYNSSNFTVTVSNKNPSININFDNTTIVNNQRVKVFDNDLWIIDASKSNDTINDLDDLRFEWFANNQLISINGSIYSFDLQGIGKFEIKLILHDSDGGSDVFEFTLDIENTNNQGIQSKNTLLYPAIILIIVLSITSFTWLLKRRGGNFNLPKWGNND